MRMSPPHKLIRRPVVRVLARPQKKAVNLSINRELLDRARKCEINLSNVLEDALEQKLQQQASERWMTDNRAAIEVYNEEVETRGIFSDNVRTF
jgi:antitoxin CcdA